MPLEDDIIAFKRWANQIGVPTETLPNDDALKSVLKSRQGGDIMLNLMRRIRSKIHIKKSRLNSLISKTEKLDGQFTTTLERSFLPKEMQRYCEIENLRKAKAQIESKITELKSVYESTMGTVRSKNLYKIQLQHSLENITARTNILEVKLDSLNEAMSKEEVNKKRITDLMPVKITHSNSSETLALNAMRLAINTLREFYETYSIGYNLHDDEEELWNNLRKMFADIPNWMMWNVILKASEKLSQEIIALTKEDCNEAASVTDRFSSFEVEILKARAIFLNVMQKYSAEKQLQAKHTSSFLAIFDTFQNTFNLQMSAYNIENDNIESLASDYLLAKHGYSYSKGQVEYLKKEVIQRKAQIVNGKQKVEDHQLLLNSTRQIYDEISTLVNKIVQDTSNLELIKEKTTYSKKNLQYMLNSAISNKRKLAKNGNFTDSFETSDVFCSTKLDLDNSIVNCSLRSETSVFKSNKGSPLAQHVNELLIFNELPMDNLRYSTKKCFFYIHRNPLAVSTTESPFVLQCIPNYLSTPYGSIEEIKSRIKWSSSLEKYATDKKSSVVVPEPNVAAFKARSAANAEEIVEYLDEIKTVGIRTNQKLRKVANSYKFILENVLHNFIPSGKLFNNRTYMDYYSEYLMYYRMSAKDSNEN